MVGGVSGGEAVVGDCSSGVSLVGNGSSENAVGGVDSSGISAAISGVDADASCARDGADAVDSDAGDGEVRGEGSGATKLALLDIHESIPR